MREKINIENIDGQLFKVKIVEPDDSKIASFTHYIHNHQNGVSDYYREDALEYVKDILGKEYPNEIITNVLAEDALQYLIFDLNKSIPFPASEKPIFKFI